MKIHTKVGATIDTPTLIHNKKGNVKYLFYFSFFMILLLLLLLFWYGGNHDWFKFSIFNQFNLPTPEQKDYLDTNPINPDCREEIYPSTITSGGLVTGTIYDGSDTFCEVFGKMVGTNDWRKLLEGRTNVNGIATYSDNWDISGTFIFRVICGDCITSPVTLVVNPAPPSLTCSDTDGRNKMSAGFMTYDGYSYYDDCFGNSAVKEYWCNGNTPSETLLLCDIGYSCFETRGGDYCKRNLDDGGSEDGSGSQDYTCGKSEWCNSGTCPTGYNCNEIESLSNRWCACITGLDNGEVHPDWKIGGKYYNPRQL